ncbi:MAG: hypothetical protein ACREVE_15530 [Gammaproteobacteria bacterium]
MQTRVAGYPALDLTFEYDSQGNLANAHHELETEDCEQTALLESERKLALFWEVMNYRYGVPLITRTRTVMPVNDPHDRTHHTVTFKCNSILVKPIELPKPDALAIADTRLQVWLYLANHARDSVSYADALLTYYIILEDIHGPIAGSDTEPKGQVRHMRDFVAHAKIGKEALVRFLASELGVRTEQYDPTNKSHQDLVRKYRDVARSLVHSELETRL